MDHDRRYYYRPLYGPLTPEDEAIIRNRCIPTVDQERAAYYEMGGLLDGKFQCNRQANLRKVWRIRRERLGIVGVATWAGL